MISHHYKAFEILFKETFLLLSIISFFCEPQGKEKGTELHVKAGPSPCHASAPHAAFIQFNMKVKRYFQYFHNSWQQPHTVSSDNTPAAVSAATALNHQNSGHGANTCHQDWPYFGILLFHAQLFVNCKCKSNWVLEIVFKRCELTESGSCAN